MMISFQNTFAVVGVIDLEVYGVSVLLGLNAEDLCETVVKCDHPEIFWREVTNDPGDPIFHLSGRLVGKGKCEDVERIYAPFHQTCDAVGENPCFSLLCYRGDHQRTFCRVCRCSL
jgi:hypothetical protein